MQYVRTAGKKASPHIYGTRTATAFNILKKLYAINVHDLPSRLRFPEN